MPIDTIGDLNLQIADIEAGGIEREAQAVRGLGQDIGGSIQGALQGAEILQRNEIDIQKQKEVDELLKSGSDGVAQYAQELGIKDPTVYTKMAETVKDPKKFVDIYGLMKKRSDKDIREREFSELISGVSGTLQEAMSTTDPEKIATAKNTVNAAKGKTTNPDAVKQLDSMLKGLTDHEERTRTGAGRVGKPGEATKGLLSLRNQFIKETKDIETVLGQTSILRSAFSDGVFVNKKGEKKRVGSDQALVMTFNKILDPTSVVRESEFNRTGQALGAVESLFGWLNKLDEGGAGLTDDGRKAIFKMSEVISRGKLLDKFNLISDFDRLGQLEKVSPEDADLIIPGFSKFKDDYSEWKRNPDAFVDKLVVELESTLNEARSGEVTKGDKTTTAVSAPSGKPNRRVATSIEEF